jgi:hypothetical protein
MINYLTRFEKLSKFLILCYFSQILAKDPSFLLLATLSMDVNEVDGDMEYFHTLLPATQIVPHSQSLLGRIFSSRSSSQRSLRSSIRMKKITKFPFYLTN